jgi:hypothetical protein
VRRSICPRPLLSMSISSSTGPTRCRYSVDISHPLRYLQRISLSEGTCSRDTPEHGASAVPAGGACNPVLGRSGHRVGRHYDRSARCLAGLGQRRRVTPDVRTSQETRPGLSHGIDLRGKRRGGAPRGERSPMRPQPRPKHSRMATSESVARPMEGAPVGAPPPFVGGGFWNGVCKTRMRWHRENESACRD